MVILELLRADYLALLKTPLDIFCMAFMDAFSIMAKLSRIVSFNSAMASLGIYLRAL